MREKLTPNILVIGAGVSGLTTAISLREVGFKVTITADRFAPDLTSTVAGALWEWPPAVCGHHGAPRSLERSKKWCMTSYDKFKQMHADFGSESTGIYLRDVYFYFKDVLENQPADLNKMNELKDKVDGFEKGLQIVKSSINLKFQGGIKDAYKHMSPMINTDIYMKWLLQYAQNIGCKFLVENWRIRLISRSMMGVRTSFKIETASKMQTPANDVSCPIFKGRYATALVSRTLMAEVIAKISTRFVSPL